MHWAGTETSDEWAGYMEGAVVSGRRAAMEVLQINKCVKQQEGYALTSGVDAGSSKKYFVLIGTVAVGLCAFYAVKNSKNFFKVR